MDPQHTLIDSFRAAVAATSPDLCVAKALPPPPRNGRTIVIGAGKAAASMAAAVERHWPEGLALTGLVITRHGHGWPTKKIEVVEAGHPLPDRQGLQASQRILDMVRSAGAQDLVLALVSGGGSSLLTLPESDLSLADIQGLIKDLLGSGATIQEINTVRKRLSRTLGGKLALNCRAEVHVLVMSDVVGDDPAHVASGPFHPDASTHQDALAILQRHGITPRGSVAGYLAGLSQGMHPETPKPGHACFARVTHRIVASSDTALTGAEAYFKRHGITCLRISDTIMGDAADQGRYHAALARCLRMSGHRGLALLSGGETTVKVEGPGRGGRNSHFLLSLAGALQGLPGVHALAADTDGIDGTEDNAGAVMHPDTLARAMGLGMDWQVSLARNDAYGYFQALDALLVTGPTRINVNDYRVLYLA